LLIYVASHHRGRAGAFMERVRELGHTISYDWVANWDPRTDQEARKVLALEQFKAIRKSDLLVLLWTGNARTPYHETGIAIGMGKPVIVSDTKHLSLVYQLPRVVVVDCDREALRLIERWFDRATWPFV
jgi:hypothetical protein